MTSKQKAKMGMYEMALELQEDFARLDKQVGKGTRDFVNKMAESVKTLAKQKVPVKTGKTKSSIRSNDAKYSIATVSVDSWLEAWVNKGGGSYHKGTVDITARYGTNRNYRQRHYNTTRSKIKESKRLKSHPAYYLTRPAKQLMQSVKSKKTYERYLNLAMKESKNG